MSLSNPVLQYGWNWDVEIIVYRVFLWFNDVFTQADWWTYQCSWLDSSRCLPVIYSPLPAVPAVVIYSVSSTVPSSSTDQIKDTAVKSAVKERCLLCGLTPGSEQCFGKHIRRGEESGHTMYKCKVCTYEHRHRADMKVHLTTHTGEKPPTTNQIRHKGQRVKGQ